MLFSNLPNVLLFASAVVASVVPRQAVPRQVYAHYIVGITNGQSADKWRTDITDAKNSGIDGFALNIGPSDSYTETQLTLAYDTAASVGGFSMFISFDQNAGYNWDPNAVITFINNYKGKASQLRLNNLPVVSTFEGPNWSDNWPNVRSQTGGIFLIPDWASLGAGGVAGKLGLIDGAFNWGAWPEANQRLVSTGNDVAYKNVLQGKPYMMGVSPYFYSSLPQYGKNWYSSSDRLWYDRWRQVLEIQPELIEIITWNDYGESSYINAPTAAQIVAGAEGYVNGFDHTAFRFVLPYFISAYKAGNADVALPSEGAVAWYRTSSKTVCGDGGTVWGQGGGASAVGGTDDVVSVIALTNSPVAITVSIGGSSTTVDPTESVGKAHFYSVPFNGRTGAVSVSLIGRTSTGPEISGGCPGIGKVNFNAATIQV